MEKEIIKDKTLDEKMAIADEISRNYFRQGLNCTECVLRTFMDMYETDLPDDILCMIAGLTKMSYKKFMMIILLCKPFGLLLYSQGLTFLLQWVVGLF